MTERPEIITATIATFTQMSGLSRATIYRLMDSGALRSVKIGTRRLIVVESYREYLAGLHSHIPSPISIRASGAQRDTQRHHADGRIRGES